MQHRTSGWLKSVCLVTFLAAGCQSKISSDNSKTALTGPPELNTVAPDVGLESQDQTSQAESIAARARQDLLDSMAMGPDSSPILESDSIERPNSAPVVTWNQPDSEPIEIVEPTVTKPASTRRVEAVEAAEQAVQSAASAVTHSIGGVTRATGHMLGVARRYRLARARSQALKRSCAPAPASEPAEPAEPVKEFREE